MIFYRIDTNEYPLHIGDIFLIYPDWSKEKTLPENIVEVEEGPIPSLNENEYLDEVHPQFIDGKWQRTYEIHTYTEELKNDLANQLEEIKKWEKLFNLENPRPETAVIEGVFDGGNNL